MGKKCPRPDCGYDGNDPEWEFCGHCGNEMDTSPSISSPPQHAAVSRPRKDAEQPLPQNYIAEPVSALLAQKSTAKLVIKNAGRVGHEFPITGDSVNIGRWDADGGAFPEIDLSQDDPENYVSRKHALISIKSGRCYIEDLGSSNGTFLNKGPRLVPGVQQELKNGDEIVIGKTVLSYLR